MNAPEPIPFKTEGPQPLVRQIPPGNPYPVAALGPLRDAVEAVQGMTQAPVAIPAASALSVASLAVQGFADVETGWFGARVVHRNGRNRAARSTVVETASRRSRVSDRRTKKPA